MALTQAQRARRYRKHRQGDHSLCDPARCSGNATDGERRPPRLGPRGRWLWEELMAGAELDAGRRVLAEEACRLADRMDRLDALLRGDIRGWITFARDDDTGDVTVIVDQGLREARQHALALKQILTDLRTAAGQRQQGGGSIDQFTARRKARRARAAS